MSGLREECVVQKARCRLRKAVEVLSLGIVHSLQRRRISSAEDVEKTLESTINALESLQEE